MRKWALIVMLVALLLAVAPTPFMVQASPPVAPKLSPTRTVTPTRVVTRAPTNTPTPYPEPFPAPDWMRVGPGGLSYGATVDTAGDVNGDGYADVLVGQPGNTPEGGYGAVDLYYGSAAGLTKAPAWRMLGRDPGSSNQFGQSVSAAGDVNGDGYDDVLIGQPDYTIGYSNQGRVYLFYGSPSGLKSVADWSASPRISLAYFGKVVNDAGDVNGDGYDDVFVGAYGVNSGAGWAQGRAYVWCGSPAGLTDTPCWTADGDQLKGYFGDGASGGVGDVNDDGYEDLLVAAPRYDAGQPDAGRVYLYYGSPDGLSSAPGWVAEGEQAGALFGSGGGAAGDVNGDGYADIILGAPYFDAGQTDEGRAMVYLGSPTGPSATPVWIADGEQANAYFGSAAGSAGDMDGNGCAEIVVGAYLYDNGQRNEGMAFLYRGSPTGPAAAPSELIEADLTETYFGNAVGSGGDVNRDGGSDLLIGAVSYNGNTVNVGAVFAYYGEAVAPQLTYTPTPTATASETPTLTPTVTATPTITPTQPDNAIPLYLPLVVQGQ